ncbi:neuroglian-like isoform X1 [Mizuhopecten yessoensis]|nr:neuroglian-like isoform X1 [Mizuhopecten yessoensis]XP_021368215.1 neuroglian-like isoform X1 [Mizuhopecten yessoensis]XP_021368319.1 neuroglian-like isoform X1 [Mizuhopecten yessoensis]XP_021368402.1 neuroglian-like isoform X1 [Mizuhopecten yessoensis]XP_021368471.1 neuroglian-like isoform X1 [Mizuhopecten yessoensis]XP_021368550.1 neuroglian-like isoform X1 [Mizuhopecten yessoensis]XP_021368631.1 neuroglian-like isoform X1 [Mizuhopecten yessoensis]XP_021368713.1 neuroglian-like isoform 
MAAFQNLVPTLLLFINIPSSLLERIVDRPPQVIQQPSPIPYRDCPECTQGDRVLVYFKVGDTITLTCQASGRPAPEYTWTKNGKEIDFDAIEYISPTTNITRIVSEVSGGSLTIDETSDYDVAIYQCSAYNRLGRSLSKKVQMIKAVNEPFPSVTVPKRVSVVVGNSATLTCSPPLSIPKAIVYWTDTNDPSSAGSRIKLDDRVVMDYSGKLHFANVIPSDNRNGEAYVCNAWQKSVFRSFLQGDDKIIQTKGSMGKFPVSKMWNSNRTVTGLLGETAKFMCIFAGNPTPKIIWKHSGSLMENTGHELIIKNLKYSHQGDYECEGQNKLSKGITVTFSLTIQSKPSWATPPVNQDVGVTEDATFQCIPQGLPKPTVEWFINGKPISEVPATRRTLANDVLTFQNLDKQDSQVIQCLATNKHGTLWADVYLNVLAYAPEITSGPGQLTVAERQSVTLTCVNDGKPQPVLTWNKGAQILRGTRYTQTGSSITIADVSSGDGGTYTCAATNVYGTKSSTGSLTVRKRTRIVSAPLDKNVTYPSPVIFKCQAFTDSAESDNLKISWLKDGVPFDISDPNIEMRPDGFKIKETSSAYTANYTCWAHNGIDEAKSVAQLKVRAPPDPSSNIFILNCDARSVSLRWTKSRDNFSPIQRYVVEQHNGFNPGQWKFLAETDGTVTEVNAELSAWVNYTFRVKAVNDFGEGMPSDPTGTVCRTQKDYPDRHPENVHIIDNKPNFLIVEWDAMDPILHNAPGFQYKLTAKNKKTGFTHQFVFDDYLETRKEIQTGDVFQEYEIYVMAVNEIGNAVPVPLTNIGHSGMSVPIVVPGNFEVDPDVNMTYDDAGFRWDPVDDSPESMQGKFEGYKIRYWTPDNPDKKFEVIVRKEFLQGERSRRATLKETARVKNLPAYTPLLLDVVAINTYFESNSSNVLNLTTPEGVPDKVRRLRATSRGVVYIKLSWEEPERPSGKITGYEVSYEEIHGLTLGNTIISNDTIIELNGGLITRVNGLNENTQYRIHVQAKTGEGLGEDMYIDVMTAIPGDPAIPKIDTITPHFDAINVSWTINANHDRAGYNHYVEYRRQGNNKWSEMPGELMKSWQLVPNLTSGVTYEVQVVATSGQEIKRSSIRTVATLGAQVAYTPEVYESLWFIIMLVALALLIIIFIIVCLVKRSRGDKYHVQENERLKGIPPEDKKSALVNDFNENGEKQPLAGSSDPDLEKAGLDSEQDSLEEYGDVDPSRFNEDGSFIGQYGAQNVSTADETQPSAMHTFV